MYKNCKGLPNPYSSKRLNKQNTSKDSMLRHSNQYLFLESKKRLLIL